MGWGSGGERTQVYVLLRPCIIHLKLHCWSATPQYKMFLVFKKKKEKKFLLFMPFSLPLVMAALTNLDSAYVYVIKVAFQTPDGYLAETP